MEPNEQAQSFFARLKTLGFAAGVLGIVGWVVAFTSGRDAALQSYLFAWVFWIGVTLGCFSLTLLHAMIRGNWSKPLLRLAEAGGGAVALAVMGLLVIPILVFLPDLYLWARPEAAQDHILHAKAGYLNLPFFIGRTIFYFAVWIAFASVLRRSSLQQDQTGDSSEADRRASIGAPGIVVYVLTITFAFVDWVMSLDPHWYSTIYGLWFVVSHGLCGVSLLAMIVTRLKDTPPYRDVVTPVFTRDVGNVMLALTMFWGYFSLSQYLIIFSGNLPEEITYFMARMQGTWHVLGTILVLGQFFTPFLALLSGKTKRSPGLLFNVALLIFVMRILDHFWTIVPFFAHGAHDVPMTSYWAVIPAWLAIGGIWMAAFTTVLAKAPLMPRHEVALPREVAEHA